MMFIVKRALKEVLDARLPWSLWGLVHKLKTGSLKYPWRFRKYRVGENCYIDPSVQIFGWKSVAVGSNTVLSEEVWLNANDRGTDKETIIVGNNCHIGRRNYFSAGPLIHIKDYCLTGIDCHFLGCAHVFDSPQVPYISAGVTKGEAIEVGVNCMLATSVTVLQGVRIGFGSIVGARSVVVSSLPPFSIAVGNPCKGIKRYDFKNNRWVDIREWLNEYEQFMPTEAEYLATLKERHGAIPLSLMASSRRFGWL